MEDGAENMRPDGLDSGAAPAHEWAGGRVRHATLAVTFLTGIPLRQRGESRPADLWRSMGWYPLVGLMLGAAAWGAYSILIVILPGLVAAATVVLLLEVVTRGLHMDGLMDTADGLFSGAPRDRALEIMKDSHAGAMGVLAAILVVTLKITALGSLAGPDAALPLIAGWAIARALPPLDVYIWPYARPAGTGEAFTRERTLGPVALAGGFVALALVLAGVLASGIGGAGSWWGGIVMAGACLAVVLGVHVVVAKRLGGLTGDVYGMGVTLAETIALVVGCALAQ